MQPVGVQEWIHKLEEGEGTKYIRIAFCFLALLGLTAMWHIREAKNFTSIEAMDAAQLARNISRGEGFTTQFVRPVSIALLEKEHGENPDYLQKRHPDLANPPVYPLLLAGLMKVLPFDWTISTATFWRYQPEMIIGGLNQVLFFASLAMLFRVSMRLFDKSVATLAVVLMALTEMFWDLTTSGLSTMLLIFLVLLLTDLLLTFDEGARSGLKGKGWLISFAVACGLLAGLLALTRYSMGWLLVPVVLYLAFTGVSARVPAAVCAMAAFALVCAPWLVRNYNLSGRIFGTAGLAIHQGTTGLPGFTLERSMPRNIVLDLNKIDLNQYPRKLFTNGRDILVNELPRTGGTWIAALFAAGLLIHFRNPALNRLKFFTAGTILLFLIVQALGRTGLSAQSPGLNSENLLVVFTPLFFVFGAGFFFILLDQIELAVPWFRSLIISAFVLILSLPLIFRLLPPREAPVTYPPYLPNLTQTVSRWMDAKELMMSDMPWAIAWYGDRQCVWTTLDVGKNPKDDFYRINDTYKAIKALYLTPITTNDRFLTEMWKSREGIWGKFYLDVVVLKDLPTGYPLKIAPPGLLPDMLFLSDRIRWQK